MISKLIFTMIVLKNISFGQSVYLKNFEPDSLRLKIVDAQRCEEAPVIDGYLTDSCWQQTKSVDEFFQIEPKELSAP